MVSKELLWSGLGCGEHGNVAAGEGAAGGAGGQSVATGRGDDPAGLEVTTGMEMTEMLGGGSGGDVGAGPHLLMGALRTLWTWSVDL